MSLQKMMLSLLPNEGIFETKVENLSLVRCDEVMHKRSPVIYDACIYVVIQGTKVAYLGSEAYHYDKLNYLVLSVPLPLECQILKASPQEPYLAVKIDIDSHMLTELLQQFPEKLPTKNLQIERGIFVSEVNKEINDIIARLLSYSDKDAQAKMLAPLAIKELFFHIIQGAQGDQLRSYANRDRHSYQIAGVIKYIKSNYSENLGVAELASQANMSESSFYQYFKVITNVSPIQYIKSIRLYEARRKMLFDNDSVSNAAYQVGYASASQFSREYKRLFGISPSLDAREFEQLLN